MVTAVRTGRSAGKAREGEGGGGDAPPSPPPRPLASRRGAPPRGWPVMLALFLLVFFYGICYVGIFYFLNGGWPLLLAFFFVMCCYYYSAPEDGEREARRDRPSSMFFVMFCLGHDRYRGDE